MITVELITALFSEIDEQRRAIPKHPEAHLWPSEVVTLGLLHALKGVGNRPFYRWLTRDYRPLFPRLPERTRLFRLLTTHHKARQNILYTSAEINRPYSAQYSSTPCARVQTAIIARLEKVIEPDA
jgi:hypothetical protein